MAQHDYVIANGTGAAVRSDLNNALAAIVSQNSGATEPATTYAYQFWADTTTATLKLRNSANSAWIELMQLDGTLTMEDGTEALPGLSFRNDLDTGLWRPGANQLAISTNAVERVEFGASEVVFNDGGANYDFRVEGDTNANLLFVDASADAVGIGVSSPGEVLDVAGQTRVTNTAAGSGLVIKRSDSVNANGALNFTGSDNTVDASVRMATDVADALTFQTAGSEKVRITSGGAVGIGATTVDQLLHVLKNQNGETGILVENQWGTSGANSSLTLKTADVAGSSTSTFGINKYKNGSVIVANNETNSAANISFTVGSSERARIDSAGRWLLGTSNNNSNFDSAIQIAGNGSAGTQLITAFNNNTNGAELYLAKSRSGTVGTNTIVQSGDRVGFIGFYGADGTTYRDAARIEAFVDGTPGSADMPGRLVFSTTADGASSPTERMRIANHGGVVINRALNDSSFKFYIQAEDTGSTKYAIYIDNSSFVNLFRIRNDGVFQTGTAGNSPYNLTTASAANLHCDSNGIFYRSTSSGRFKTDVEVINDSYSDALLNLRPVWYRSTAPGDAKHTDWSYWGFIAEEVAEIDPRLVFWKTHETIKIDSGSPDVLDKEEEIELETPIAEGVQYDRFVPHLLNLIKRQKQQIEALEARLTALESA